MEMMKQAKSVSTKSGVPSPTSVEVISEGIDNALSRLSRMANKEINLTGFSLKKVLVKDVPDLLGGAEALVVGVYLEVRGYIYGHMVLVYEPQTAFNLIDLLLDQAPGSTKELTEMEKSVLGEVGNIVGSSFLNHLADTTRCVIRPSPPAVMIDMAGAILDVALAPVLEQGKYTSIAEATFSTDDQQVSGKFLVLPLPTLPNMK